MVRAKNKRGTDSVLATEVEVWWPATEEWSGITDGSQGLCGTTGEHCSLHQKYIYALHLVAY